MSEMSKVEEVARAIALEDLDPETRAAVDPDKWLVSESYYALARAAIAAMKEPTPAMKTAAAFWRLSTSFGGDVDGSFDYVSEENAGEIFNAMIDASLKE